MRAFYPVTSVVRGVGGVGVVDLQRTSNGQPKAAIGGRRRFDFPLSSIMGTCTAEALCCRCRADLSSRHLTGLPLSVSDATKATDFSNACRCPVHKPGYHLNMVLGHSDLLASPVRLS